MMKLTFGKYVSFISPIPTKKSSVKKDFFKNVKYIILVICFTI